MPSTAEPSDRARLYEALGVTATYDADTRNAVLQVVVPRSAKNVSEGTCGSKQLPAHTSGLASGVEEVERSELSGWSVKASTGRDEDPE